MTLNYVTKRGLHPIEAIRRKLFDAIIPDVAATTLTVSNVLGGQLSVGDAGLGQATVLTFPTAAQLVGDLRLHGVEEGNDFPLNIRNGENTGGITVTLAVPMGGGGTLDGVGIYVVDPNETRNYRVVITGVTPGSESYTVYDITSGLNQ